MKIHRNSDLANQLLENEELLWVGQPKKGLVLRKGDYILLGWNLGMLALAFTMFASQFATIGGTGYLFPVFILAFVLIAISLHFIADAVRRQHAIYGLTNQRVIIQTGNAIKKLETVALNSLPGLELTERKDGSGTITFFEKNASNYWGYSRVLRQMMPANSHRQILPAFDLIPNVKNVYNKILELKQH